MTSSVNSNLPQKTATAEKASPPTTRATLKGVKPDPDIMKVDQKAVETFSQEKTVSHELKGRHATEQPPSEDSLAGEVHTVAHEEVFFITAEKSTVPQSTKEHSIRPIESGAKNSGSPASIDFASRFMVTNESKIQLNSYLINNFEDILAFSLDNNNQAKSLSQVEFKEVIERGIEAIVILHPENKEIYGKQEDIELFANLLSQQKVQINNTLPPKTKQLFNQLTPASLSQYTAHVFDDNQWNNFRIQLSVTLNAPSSTITDMEEESEKSKRNAIREQNLRSTITSKPQETKSKKKKEVYEPEIAKQHIKFKKPVSLKLSDREKKAEKRKEEKDIERYEKSREEVNRGVVEYGKKKKEIERSLLRRNEIISRKRVKGKGP